MSEFPFVPGQTYSADEIQDALGLPAAFLEQDEYRVAWTDEDGVAHWGGDGHDHG